MRKQWMIKFTSNKTASPWAKHQRAELIYILCYRNDVPIIFCRVRIIILGQQLALF